MQKLEGPYELYSSIPSRPFFPRGFLWDEGFHLLPIIDWDADLTLQIIKSWFNLMDEDGWIMREAILGNEARSKVPQEFQTQYPHYANPPTLFFVLRSFLDKLAAASSPETAHSQTTLGHEEANKVLRNKQVALSYLRDLYPLLKRHFDWFRKTQWGDLKSYDRPAFSSKEGYRWRGSTQTHLLTSGLDDYPRPQPPHPGELHTDLISWMGMMSRAMKRIASSLGETDDAATYGKMEEAIVRNIDDLHWDESAQAYCDATIDDYEESVHVCHKGYISLFPFMTGLMGPDHAHLGAVLDLIADEDELWSPHGIRSLSKQDEFYGTAENYWRSPIWMNMNYLIVKELFVSHFSDTLLLPLAFLPALAFFSSLPFSSSSSLFPPPFLFNFGLADTYASRPLPALPAPTKAEQTRSTRHCAATWSRRSTTAGRRRASRGSSTTRRLGGASAPNTLPAGPVLWSRFSACQRRRMWLLHLLLLLLLLHLHLLLLLGRKPRRRRKRKRKRRM